MLITKIQLNVFAIYVGILIFGKQLSTIPTYEEVAINLHRRVNWIYILEMTKIGMLCFVNAIMSDGLSILDSLLSYV